MITTSVIATLLFLLFLFLQFGIKVKSSVDFDRDYFVANFNLLGNVLVFKIKLQLENGKIFYQINTGKQKELKVGAKETKKKVKAQKRLKVKKAVLHIACGSSGAFETSLIVANITILTDILLNAINGLIVIENFEKVIFANYQKQTFKCNLFVSFSFLNLIKFALNLRKQKDFIYGNRYFQNAQK
ncbi:MAG: hypothetical protein RR374_02970 [Clostridia bacterium]